MPLLIPSPLHFLRSAPLDISRRRELPFSPGALFLLPGARPPISLCSAPWLELSDAAQSPVVLAPLPAATPHGAPSLLLCAPVSLARRAPWLAPLLGLRPAPLSRGPLSHSLGFCFSLSSGSWPTALLSLLQHVTASTAPLPLLWPSALLWRALAESLHRRRAPLAPLLLRASSAYPCARAPARLLLRSLCTQLSGSHAPFLLARVAPQLPGVPSLPCARYKFPSPIISRSLLVMAACSSSGSVMTSPSFLGSLRTELPCYSFLLPCRA
jgi:hypothetical protein